MISIAIVGWLVFAIVAFGLRTLIHLRQSGTTGFVGLRNDASLVERIAGALLVVATVLSLAAPFVGRPLAPTAWIGAAVIAIATLATFFCQLAMARSWRIGVDPHARTELVTRGPFALVRNPIFTCMIAGTIGLTLACPTPLALLSPVLLVIALELQVRFVEEPYLVRVHGDAYRAYLRSTGRFVPMLGRVG